MKRMNCIFIMIAILVIASSGLTAGESLVWPPAPDEPRIAYLGDVNCDELKPKSGFFGKLSRIVGGHSDDDRISLPYDIRIVGTRLFLVCQNVAGLVVVDRVNKKFRIITDDKKTVRYPIALCRGEGQDIFMTDSEAASVYKYSDGELHRFITKGLSRPTGIAADAVKRRLYIVDTGEHLVRAYDFEGNALEAIPSEADSLLTFNYPTFAKFTREGSLLVNDGLNYQIRLISGAGILENSFGFEGDGPGAFARPKGIAVDSDENIYVIDNLFDNFQVFDKDGRLLLVVGGAGQSEGQFWSPAGIDIVSDTIYIADTYNNRIQIMHYLGGER
jgi:hypothetical protein